jgi:dTDP-4-amino-4,6-dideoxygalactose transaminase
MRARLTLDIGWTRLIWAAFGAPTSASDVEAARSAIAATFATGHLVFALSVRTLFDALLEEVATSEGAPVLMSGVNIQNMADLVRAHGFSIHAVDVASETLAPAPGALLSAQAQTGARVCVIAQLFGAANPIEDAAALRSRGVMVIEDAAQAFCGSAHAGLPDADVSLFSFGPIKRRTALGGAIGVFRDATLATRIKGRLQNYPALSDRWFRQRALKYLLLKSASTPWIYGLLMRAIELSGRNPDAVIGGAARGFGGKALLQAIKFQLPPRMFVLMGRQISTTPTASTRRAACDAFTASLPASARIGAEARDNAYWLMPVRALDPDDLVKRMRAAGFDATRGATSLRALDPERTQQARLLMDGVVYLPNPADLAPKARDELKRAAIDALQAQDQPTQKMG